MEYQLTRVARRSKAKKIVVRCHMTLFLPSPQKIPTYVNTFPLITGQQQHSTILNRLYKEKITILTDKNNIMITIEDVFLFLIHIKLIKNRLIVPTV